MMGYRLKKENVFMNIRMCGKCLLFWETFGKIFNIFHLPFVYFKKFGTLNVDIWLWFFPPLEGKYSSITLTLPITSISFAFLGTSKIFICHYSMAACYL